MSGVSTSMGLGWVEFSAAIDLSKAAGTYDLATASGDLLLFSGTVFCTTVGATFTACAINTDDTTPFVIADASRGAVANWIAGSQLNTNWICSNIRAVLRSGKKIQQVMTGTTGSGAGTLTLIGFQLTAGAKFT